MACHYSENGHTRPVVGAVYVRWLRWSGENDRYRLVSLNEATGMARLVGTSGSRFVRISALSHWHIVAGG